MAEMTITIPKIEYIKLKQQAAAYREFVSRMFELPLRDPIDEVVEDFRNIKLYSDSLLIENIEHSFLLTAQLPKYFKLRSIIKKRDSRLSICVVLLWISINSPPNLRKRYRARCSSQGN